MTDAFDSGRDQVTATAPGAATAADLSRGPGQRLRQARLRRGLELRQVAREMRLTVERVQAIEEDDYAALPDPVFVIGYIKTYARLMDMNPEALATVYRTLQAQSLPPPKPKSAAIPPMVKPSPEAARAKPAATPLPGSAPRPARFGRKSSSPGTVSGQEGDQIGVQPEDQPKDKDQSKGQARRQGFAWVALAAALLVLVLAWWTQRPVETSASLDGSQESIPEPMSQPLSPIGKELPRELPSAALLNETPASHRATATEDEAEVAPEPVAEEDEVDGELPQVPAADEVVNATTPSAATPPLEVDVAQVVDKLDVVIRFTGPASVDVRDSTMNYALVGEMDKGDQYLLGGKPPYSLIIGNAAAVELLVGGKPFDFQAVVRGNVARFILDPAPATPAPDLRHPRP